MIDMTEDGRRSIGFLLYHAATVLRPPVAAELKRLGIGMPEYACLTHLNEQPAASTAELARRMAISPQAINTVVRELQDLGALSRPDNVSTGRSLPIRLTPKGRGLFDRADRAVRTSSEHLLANLSADERIELVRLLNRIDVR
ncbi:regulatory protein MarR [Mycolicibacterium rhodesiae JS60]|nr:regulatory protein MarR [Mycolicibacterium rhodesiae JS60]